MQQTTYNKLSVTISIIALFLSVSFPFFKEAYLDKPKVFTSSSKYLNLTHQFGNSMLGLNLNLVNTGEKATIVTRVEVALFNASNEILIKPKEARIVNPNGNYQNSIALNSKLESSNFIYLDLNDADNEEILEEINNLNESAIKDLDRQGCTIYNYPGQGMSNIQLCDSIFSKINNFSINNLESLKIGDYKILYFLYQDGENAPLTPLGKSFKITRKNKEALVMSINNYRWGSHLYFTNKLQYSDLVNIRAYDLNSEDINILKEKIKKNPN